MQVGGFDDVPTTTSDNIALGTLYYLSPKMSRAFASHCSHNLAHVTHRTDVFLASGLMRSYKEELGDSLEVVWQLHTNWMGQIEIMGGSEVDPAHLSNSSSTLTGRAIWSMQ
jgi:hypothetical protein